MSDSLLKTARISLRSGQDLTPEHTIKALTELFASNPISRVPLLGLLTLNGKPYTLADHFPFEPLYKVIKPKRLLLKCGRQVAKSTNLAADGILSVASTPNLKILYVTPRYEQIRRLSNNYVRPFVKHSLIRPLLVDETCVQAVLQRTFANEALMYFSFALLDCERVRGISCDWINYDEIQDLDYEFIPVINECMSASDYGISFYSGTPKTLDNGMEQLWQETTKGEWVTPCHRCGKWNMACIAEDLIKMIGKETIVCAKCSRPINPREGHWYHTEGKKHLEGNIPGGPFPGYHIPQVIMPMHYEAKEGNRAKWYDLLGKMEGKNNYSKAKFINEVLGESADSGVKLITETDIRNASTLGPNDYAKCIDKFRRCKVRVLGVDWGGGGKDGVSYTVGTLVGLNSSTGKIECHYAYRFHAGHSHEEEARVLLKLFMEANCHYFAHDFGGSGSVRETMMIQAGIPIARIMGINYTRGQLHDMVRYHPPASSDFRGYYVLDKARSLGLQAICLKNGVILLPEYKSSKEITHDLLALLEDKHEAPGGSDVYLIRKVPKQSDDFAHALNFACIGIWYSEQRFPDLSLIQKFKLTPEQMEFASPPTTLF